MTTINTKFADPTLVIRPDYEDLAQAIRFADTHGVSEELDIPNNPTEGIKAIFERMKERRQEDPTSLINHIVRRKSFKLFQTHRDNTFESDSENLNSLITAEQASTFYYASAYGQARALSAIQTTSLETSEIPDEIKNDLDYRFLRMRVRMVFHRIFLDHDLDFQTIASARGLTQEHMNFLFPNATGNSLLNFEINIGAFIPPQMEEIANAIRAFFGRGDA